MSLTDWPLPLLTVHPDGSSTRSFTSAPATSLKPAMPFSRRPLPRDTEARLKVAVCLVEATSYEVICLWAEQSHESNRRLFRESPPIHWEQVGDGSAECVGKFGGRECWVSFQWAWLDGRLVCFWEPTSQVVDYGAIERYLDTHAPQAERCDAMNFGQCLGTIREANEVARSAEADQLQEAATS